LTGLFKYLTLRFYYKRQCSYFPRKNLAHNQSALLFPLKRRLKNSLCCAQPCTHMKMHTHTQANFHKLNPVHSIVHSSTNSLFIKLGKV